MTREVLQLALEALKTWAVMQPNTTACAIRIPAIVALKAALAQPEQEPVAWQWLDTATFRKKIPPTGESECWNRLFTSPPQRQPLTDTEIEAIYFEHWMNYEDLHIAKQFARAIEAKHGIGEKT
jgi:hypothetical protein